MEICLDCNAEPCECSKPLSLIDLFEFNGRQFYPSTNIVSKLTKEQQLSLSRRVLEGFSADVESMSGWSAGVQRGLDLCVQETQSRSTPWIGACNYKSPTLAKAALQFSDRTTTELMRQRDLVTVNVIGRDDENVKQKQADRVAIYENYQINEKMSEWRDEHEKMLYLLPYHGTVFKKIYFDPSLQRNVCDLITYPNFALDNTCPSISRLRRFSIPLVKSKNAVIERLNSGEWIDTGIQYGDAPDTSDNVNAPLAANAEQDHMTAFIEQQCYFDVDGDGYEEPYTVVVQNGSGAVVRVTPRYEMSEIFVKVGGNSTNAEQTFGIYDEILYIEPNTNLIMYGMEHDPQGGLLFEGYGHILASLTEAINTTTNQLVDAGSLANTSGGWLSKGFRVKMADASFAPGEFKQSALPPEQLQSGIMLNPTKEPSQVLYALRNDFIAASNEYSASADLSQSLGAQAPAATTLALIQEKQLSSAAIILRIYRTMANEFKILYKLDGLFLDEEQYRQIVDDEEASSDDFFNNLDITPSANPEISSRMMRIQQANAEMAVMESVAGAGGDIMPIVKGYYEAIGSTYIDEIFPEETPEKQLQALLQRNPQLSDLLMQAQKQTEMIAQKQAEGIDAQNAVLHAQASELDAKAKEKMINIDSLVSSTAAELDLKEEQIKKVRSETILNLEKAESESIKNGIDKYTYAAGLDAPKETMEDDGLEEESPEDYEDDEEEPITERIQDPDTGEYHTATLVNGEWVIS